MQTARTVAGSRKEQVHTGNPAAAPKYAGPDERASGENIGRACLVGLRGTGGGPAAESPGRPFPFRRTAGIEGGSAVTRYFRGSATHKLDAKGRVSLPSDYREVLRAHGSEQVFVVVPAGEDEACHTGFTLAGHDLLVRQIEDFPFEDEDEAIETRRRYIGDARTLAIEEGGRFVLPRDLRQPLGLTNEVFFFGDGATFQLWHPETYRAEQSTRRTKARPRKMRLKGV